jgi:hypothetical protein
MSDTDLAWTLFALVVANTILVALAYISAVRESKNHSETAPIMSLRQMARLIWLYAMSNARSIALAAALGSLWSMIWFHWFGPLAIAPGVALAALILLRPVKTLLGSFRAKGCTDSG